MVIKVQNDYGTLHASCELLNVWFCDNPSNDCYEALERKMHSLYGTGTNIDYIWIDTEDMSVSIFMIDDEGILPRCPVAYHYLFRNYDTCDLFRFVGFFSRKKLEFVNGRATYRKNVNRYRTPVGSYHNS